MDVLRAQLAAVEQERDNAVAARQAAETARIAAVAAAAAAAGQAAGQPGAVVFALSPALASSTLLDYNSSEGMKIYGKATAPMEMPFTGESGNLRLFLSKVNHRATQFGWGSILKVDQDGQVFDFMKNHGQVKLKAIRIKAAITETAGSRDTQNSSQLYTFLITSVTDGMLGRIISHTDDYTSAGGFSDGLSLLKVIINITNVDTRAQSGHIRACIHNLSTTIRTPEYNCNIEKFNEYVVILEEGLAARGEMSFDTMMHVQAAYQTCKDAEFVRHTKDEYSKWEHGATLTLRGLMDTALTEYKTLKMKGLWESPSPEQEQIIALTAAVASWKSRDRPGKGTKTPSGTKKEEENKGRKNTGQFAWKDVAPKSGEPTTKVMGGKTYHWCTHHDKPQWTLHNPNAFPNLCKRHPKYSEMKTAWEARGDDQGAQAAAEATAEDIQLESALAAIDEDYKSDDE
jgi:hypothetical protein